MFKVTKNSGVTNRADPTAWNTIEIEAGPVTVKLVDCWELTARVYVRGEEKMFISSAINSKAWKVLNWAYPKHLEREYLREEALYEQGEYDYYPN